MENYSALIKIRKDRVREDGTALLYMQVVINRKPDRVNLKLHWPIDKFSETQLCISRHKGDKDVNDYNMILRDAVAKANNIFKTYRLGNLSLNMETFKKEFYNHLSKTDFVKYMGQKIEERWRKKDISERTYKNANATLGKLKDFKKEILFNQLTNKFPFDFEKHLKTKFKNAKSTIWGNHKDIKTYLHIAIEENIKFDDPYAKYQNTLPDGKYQALGQDDVKKLFDYYSRQLPRSRDRRILQRFLFSCCTSLRLSDLRRIKHEWIINGVLHFMPHKTRKSEKMLELPLTTRAMQLVQESMQENELTDIIFFSYTDQFTNRRLQTIAEHLGIKTKLHNHVARETFATLYLEQGGRVEVLQKFLAHSKITTTMRYVHISKQRKKNEMQRMENLF